MSDLQLIFSNLRHAWLRNLLLIVSIVTAYVLFGILMAFDKGYNSGTEITAGRIVTTNKLSFTQPLPISHYRAIASTDGVAAASYASWFGGYYRERRNSLHTLAVDPGSYLEVYADDITLSADERETFLRQRGSILVGETLAKRFGWKTGDQLPLINQQIVRSDGTQVWTFTVAGVFKGATPVVDTNFLYFHYDLLNEVRTNDRDTIGWVVSIPGKEANPTALGERIDQLFAASRDRTTTDTERSFSQTFVAQFGDLAFVTRLILAAAFLSLLVIVSSTTALAVQRRHREIGILKGLGFSHARVFGLIVGESLMVVLMGGAIGLATAGLVVHAAGDSMATIAPGMAVSPRIIMIGLVSMLGLAVLASALPAWQAIRRPTAVVLRRT
ncbi:MAG: FtsX-like permease family protein [Pseudomonadota bacterium]